MGKGSSSSSHRSSRDTHNNNGRRRCRRLLSNCGGQLPALTRQPHGQSGTRKKEIQSGNTRRKMRRCRRLSGARVVCWSRHGRSWRVPDAGLSSSSLCAIFSIFVVVSGSTFFLFCSIFCAAPLCDASHGRAKLCSISAIVWSDVLALR